MNGQIGRGTTLKVNDIVVGGLVSISLPMTEVEAIDITSHSTSTTHKEKIAGLMDTGNATFSGNWIPDDEGQVYIVANRGAATTLVISKPSSGSWSFPIIIASSGFEAPHGEKMTFSFTVIVTGEPTRTAPTP